MRSFHLVLAGLLCLPLAACSTLAPVDEKVMVDYGSHAQLRQAERLLINTPLQNLPSQFPEAYRVTLWPSLSWAPRSFSLKINRRGKAHMEWAQFDFSNDPANLRAYQKPLTFQERDRLIAEIEASNFWSLPNSFPIVVETPYIDPETGEEVVLIEACMDGTGIWVEGIKDGNYHWSFHGCSHHKLDAIVEAFKAIAYTQ